jgi:acyl carrier protein
MQLWEIEGAVRDFVVTNFLFGQPLDLRPGESLLDRGIIDSTGVLEIIAFLEERYSIKVEDLEVNPANLGSIASISAFVGRKLERAA